MKYLSFCMTLVTLLSPGPADSTLAVAQGPITDEVAKVRYSRDIKPILAANCFSCHGADEEHREADLRLDTFENATARRDSGTAIVPGAAEKSEVMARILSHDDDLRMPPADSGKKISAEEVEILRRWIQQGAAYEKHWAFQTPERPIPPTVESSDGAPVVHPVDAFIQSRLESEGLVPSPMADARQAFRRLSLDLIGLPPTLEELAEFDALEEQSGRAAAWNHQIDRLLASPHYGEKWGRHWLDAARYADSDGFEKDKPRFVWFYRDWVVKSLNDDLPYDQFLIQQLAGDLLPNRTQDQLVATGFLRNSMINEEGGVDPEQFRMEAMFDRMDAIGKAMLGLTIQCSQCHNHKYDPLSQREYYQLFAFLNNCDEAQATVYTQTQLNERNRILAEIRQLEDQARAMIPGVDQRLADWSSGLAKPLPTWDIIRPELDSSGGQKHYLLDDGSILAQGYAPTRHTTEFTGQTSFRKLTGFRIELLNDGNLPHGGPGRSVDGLSALTEFNVQVQPLRADGNPDPAAKAVKVKFLRATADVNPPERLLDTIYDDKSNKKRVTGPIEYAIDGDNLTAWGQDIGGGRSNVPRNAVFVPERPLESEHGFRVTFRLVQMHGGWNSDDNQNNNLGRFRLSVADHEDPQADLIPATVREIAKQSIDQWTRQQHRDVFSTWRLQQAELQDLNSSIESLWQKHPQGTTQLVLQQKAKPRDTYLLTRGDFLKPADQVFPGVPKWLNDQPVDGSSRLTFARWIANRDSPTTARAIVNRIWQEYFGTGIVQTTEDLGTQGEFPVHPELLDWLAVELMDHGWSLKHIHRLIVSSSTYQQSSRVSPELYARDPDNRLLARGPRVRVSGEIVRDIALSASGLLNRRIGGPGVYPPAPDFLFQPPASYGPKTWNLETGEDRYRRAIYTFRFRSVPYPVLENFDTPRGDTACVRRNRSNTPLQALTTLNEELFVDCARSLALNAVLDCANRQMQHTADSSEFTRVVHTMMQRCLARNPSDAESSALRSFWNLQIQNSNRRAMRSLATGRHRSRKPSRIAGRNDSPEAGRMDRGCQSDPEPG
ncbi:MAG: PSD1 and planctomycete cytochrome C domain-containing protein [Planctomycetaceae bacterium]